MPKPECSGAPQQDKLTAELILDLMPEKFIGDLDIRQNILAVRTRRAVSIW